MLCMGSCRTSQIPPSVEVPTRDDHLALGNPSNATNDPKQVSNFLIQRPTYALSCNATTNLTNWCAWHFYPPPGKGESSGIRASLSLTTHYPKVGL